MQLLLDTHIVLWLDSGATNLSAETIDRIEAVRRAGGSIFVSAVTAWEIALLVDLARISIDLPPDQWLRRFLDRPGIAQAPLTIEIASQSYRLHPLPHRDPADRLLIATAIALRCPLVTYDQRLIAFAEQHGRQHGFSAVA